MFRHLITSISLYAALAAGCAPTSSAAPEGAAPSLETRLAREGGAVMTIGRELSQGRVSLQLPHVESAASPQLLPVEGGRLHVAASGNHALHLEDLSVALSSVRIPAQRLPPAGLHIGQIHLLLADEEFLETEWLSDSEAFASGRVDFIIEWSVLFEDGTAHRLAPVLVEDVRVDVHVLLDARGRVSARADVYEADEVFDWAGLVRLSDLDLELSAREL